MAVPRQATSHRRPKLGRMVDRTHPELTGEIIAGIAPQLEDLEPFEEKMGRLTPQ